MENMSSKRADLDGVVAVGGAVHEGTQAGIQGVRLGVFEQQVCDELQQRLQAVLLPLQAPDVQLHVAHQPSQCRDLLQQDQRGTMSLCRSASSGR